MDFFQHTRLIYAQAILALFLLFSCDSSFAQSSDAQKAEAWIQHMATVHSPMPKPRPGDWLDVREETGQTIGQYVRSGPNRPDETRNKLYMVVIGEVSPKQEEILDFAEAYLNAFYGLETARLEPISLDIVPKSARRIQYWEQIHSSYLLHDVLAPRLPDDAFALIGFTATDLYPRPSWNFVFGQASLRQRVGVWSMYRYGDPEESDSTFQIALRRTLLTAGHETGHMFGIKHCIRYECAMAGSNSLEESDRRPSYFCPQCALKVCWNTNTDPATRFQKLEKFWKEAGFEATALMYHKFAELVKDAPEIPIPAVD